MAEDECSVGTFGYIIPDDKFEELGLQHGDCIFIDRVGSIKEMDLVMFSQSDNSILLDISQKHPVSKAIGKVTHLFRKLK